MKDGLVTLGTVVGPWGFCPQVFAIVPQAKPSDGPVVIVVISRVFLAPLIIIIEVLLKQFIF